MKILGWWERLWALNHVADKLRHKTCLSKGRHTSLNPEPLEGAGGSPPGRSAFSPTLACPWLRPQPSPSLAHERRAGATESEWGWRLDHLRWGRGGPSVPSPAQVT